MAADVIEWLAENPRSVEARAYRVVQRSAGVKVREVAEAIGANYHRTYRALRHLAAEGLIIWDDWASGTKGSTYGQTWFRPLRVDLPPTRSPEEVAEWLRT